MAKKALNKLLMNTKQRKMQLVTQDKKMHVAAAIASFAKREKANIVHQLFALRHGTHPNTKVKKKKKKKLTRGEISPKQRRCTGSSTNHQMKS